MTSNRTAAHAAPQSTRYIAERVNFARHRKPNRRGLVWHLDNLAADMFRAAGERAMTARAMRDR